MGLSNDLLSQFVKVTNDNKEKKETTNVYGTVVDAGDRKYVKFDGSDTTTPVSTTVDVSEGDRVIVMIKNHSAVITGNLNDPSASSSSTSNTSNQVTDLGVAVADRVTTEQLNAMRATITQEFTANDVTVQDTLNASIVSVENRLTAADAVITGRLDASEANITDLQTNKLSAEDARLTYATIEKLNSTNTTVNNLAATHASFEDATAANFTAVNADIESLETDKLDVATAKITYAEITELNNAVGRIDSLETEVGEIDTLIFGSATGSTIQTSFANAVIAQLGDAQIKSAMINDISADKITSGSIVTDNVTITSNDGKMVISDETIQISDDTRVRVQIGKDADGDYSINIWDQNGDLMFSEGGITDAAIKDAIIRNDMVANDADIHASKLDIDSLFSEINGSTNTIKSTQIYLDDEEQTLDVAFESLSSTVTEQGETISSQGTSISTIQGQISSKIWQQDIDAAKSELQGENSNLSTQYSELEQELDSISATVATHTSEIANKANSSTVTEVTDRVTSLETNLEGFQTTVSETYVNKSDVGTVNLVNDQLPGHINVGEWENIGDGWIRCRYDNSEGTSVVYATYRFALSDYVSHLAANTGMTIMVEMRDLGSTDGVYAYCYPENEAGVNLIQVKGSAYVYAVNARENISVGRTTAAYVMPESENGKAKTALGGWIVGIPAGGTADVLLRQGIYEGVYQGKYVAPVGDIRALDDRLSSAETSITQNSDSITLLAQRTEVVENAFDNYSTTAEMTSAIEQTADSITSAVSSTYSTKTETASAIEAIEVGGRNLILDSGTELIVDRNYAHSMAPVDLHVGDIYTYSVWLKASEDTTVSAYLNDDTGENRTHVHFSYGFAVTTEYQHFVFSGKTAYPATEFTADTNIRMRVYAPEGITLYGKLAKLELGNKATDWTPAPEDMATAEEVETAQTTADEAGEVAFNAETLVKQLSDSISMLVTDGNGTSLMTQTDEGWTFSTAEIQAAVDSAAESLDALTNELGDTNHTVDILQQTVDDLGEIAEYVKIGTYEDQPCIELGEADSDFKLRITNTQIMFLEGSSVVAYINNQSLYIKKAVVEEELQQGGFVWKVRSNGNMGLIWKGGI